MFGTIPNDKEGLMGSEAGSNGEIDALPSGLAARDNKGLGDFITRKR